MPRPPPEGCSRQSRPAAAGAARTHASPAAPQPGSGQKEKDMIIITYY